MKIKTLSMAVLVSFASLAAAGSAGAQSGMEFSDTGFSDTGFIKGTGFEPAHVIRANAPAQAADAAAVSELEVKLWVLNAGYDQVSGLVRDERNFYHGTALLDGATYEVMVDAAGNVLGIKE